MPDLLKEILKDNLERELKESEDLIIETENALNVATIRHKLALSQRDTIKNKIKFLENPSQ